MSQRKEAFSRRLEAPFSRARQGIPHLQERRGTAAGRTGPPASTGGVKVSPGKQDRASAAESRRGQPTELGTWWVGRACKRGASQVNGHPGTRKVQGPAAEVHELRPPAPRGQRSPGAHCAFLRALRDTFHARASRCDRWWSLSATGQPRQCRRQRRGRARRPGLNLSPAPVRPLACVWASAGDGAPRRPGSRGRRSAGSACGEGSTPSPCAHLPRAPRRRSAPRCR